MSYSIFLCSSIIGACACHVRLENISSSCSSSSRTNTIRKKLVTGRRDTAPQFNHAAWYNEPLLSKKEAPYPYLIQKLRYLPASSLVQHNSNMTSFCWLQSAYIGKAFQQTWCYKLDTGFITLNCKFDYETYGAYLYFKHNYRVWLRKWCSGLKTT